MTKKPAQQPRKKKSSKLPLSTSLALVISSLAITVISFALFNYNQFDSPSRNIPEAAKRPQPVKDYYEPLPFIPPPEVATKSYGIYNLKTGEELFSKNPNLALPPASVTKLMTAVVAVEKYDLSKLVVIPRSCTTLNASRVGFLPNEVYTLEDLLYGLLVRSGADASCAIANIADPVEFIEEMNRKANELGMTNTSFANEIGLDATEYQFSTITDLKKLADHALKSDVIRKIAGTREVTLRPQNSAISYRIQNTNELLFKTPGTTGLKTGYTTGAKECLIYTYENKGDQIMIIVLGSDDRFTDTEKLLTWAKEQIARTNSAAR